MAQQWYAPRAFTNCRRHASTCIISLFEYCYFFKYHPHEMLKREKSEKSPSLARIAMVMPIVGPGHAGAIVPCNFL